MHDDAIREKDIQRYIEIHDKYYGVTLEPSVAQKKLVKLVEFLEVTINNNSKPITKDEYEPKITERLG
jgi:hypothetical protein